MGWEEGGTRRRGLSEGNGGLSEVRWWMGGMGEDEGSSRLDTCLENEVNVYTGYWKHY
jgi:hypothetical protein